MPHVVNAVGTDIAVHAATSVPHVTLCSLLLLLSLTLERNTAGRSGQQCHPQE